MLTFDILNLDYMIEKNSLFEISKVYNIGLLRYTGFETQSLLQKLNYFAIPTFCPDLLRRHSN